MRLLLLDCYLDRPGGQGFFRPWLAPEEPVVVSLSSEPIPFRPDEVDAVVITGSRGGVVLTPEETALVDNFRHSPPEAQKAIKATSDLLAKRDHDDDGAKCA